MPLIAILPSPVSEVGPLIGSLMYGPSWFYNELIPSSGPPPTDLDPRAAIAIWQLSICDQNINEMIYKR